MSITKGNKFGVVYTSPAKLDASFNSMEDDKVYYAVGDNKNGLFKQGIYMKTISSDGDGNENITMVGCGALADGGNMPGLSKYNYDDDASTLLHNLDSSVDDLNITLGNLSDYVDTIKSFSDVSAGGQSITASKINDKITLVADGSVSITSDASKKTITIRSTDTDTKVTSAANHYAPSNYDASKISVTTGKYISVLKRDEKGHIVGYEETNLPTSVTNATNASTANKVANSLTIKGNGKNALSFDGSEVKELSIIPGTNVSIDASSNGEITISADIPGALVYMGVVSSVNDINRKNCNEANKGEVYVASSNFEGVITKNGTSTYKIEKGDMFVCNGASWDIINGEGQVTNNGVTLEYATSATIATVDGVDINITGPATPVTSLGGKTGAMTLGTATSNDDKSVNFSIDGSNKISASVPSLGNYLKSSDATSTYLSKADASTTYLKITDASYFNTIKVDNKTIVADSSKDTLELAADGSITITVDSSNDKITIKSTDTVYSHPAVGKDTSIACDTSANSAVTLSSGGTFTVVNGVYRDASGHVNKVATTTYTMPASEFTDTKLTTTVSDKKLFIVGKTDSSKATTSTAHYNANVYINDNCLYSNGKKVATSEEVTNATIYWETL